MALASMIHQLVEAPVPVLPEASRKNVRPVQSIGSGEVTPYVAKFDLSQSLLDANHMKRPRSLVDVVISVVLHIVLIGTPVFISLWYTNTIDLKAFTKTMLVLPPPPAPPPPPAVVRPAVAPRHVFFDKGQLLAPSYVPKQIAMLKEAPLPDNNSLGVEGGVPGGVPGGQMGGVIGGILGGTGSSIPAPPTVKPKAPVRVGGRVQPPRAIYNPPPEYPSVAKTARIQGVVVISAVLDERGNVVQMKVVSGPFLLYQAALDAVSRWRYQPTFLNGDPVSVEMNIFVTFQLTS